MKKKFLDKQTIITADFLNTIYGGDASNSALAADDPRKIGHVHDGGTSDGHASKINLRNHVTDSLNGNRIMSETIKKGAIFSTPTEADAIPVYETVGSTRYYKINLKGIGDPDNLGNHTATQTLEMSNNNIDMGTGSILFSIDESEKIMGGGSNDIDFHVFDTHVLTLNSESLYPAVSGGLNVGHLLNRFGAAYSESFYVVATGSSNRAISLRSPALTSSYSLVLPPNDGDASQFLQTDGSGNLSWQTASGSGSSSAGGINYLQLSDGSGGFTSRLNLFVDSNNLLSVGGTSINGIHVPGESYIDVSNTLDQKISLSYNNSRYSHPVAGTSYANIISNLGNITDVTLPIASCATPGVPIIVTSTKNNAVELQFFRNSQITVGGGVLAGGSSTNLKRLLTSGGGAGFILSSDDFNPASNTVNYDFGIFSDSVKSQYFIEAGTGIAKLVLSASEINVDGKLSLSVLDEPSSIQFNDKDGSNYVELKAANTIMSSLSFTLPTVDGSAGHSLTTDGAGNLSFASGASGMTSFTIDADNGVPQTIADGDTLTFEGGTGIDIAVSATDKITVALDYSGADSFVMAATNGTGITLDGANDKLVVYDNDASEVKYINVDQLPSGGGGQTKRSVSVLNTADGTVTGSNPMATWTFQVDPSEASNTLYVVKSIPIGNLVGGSGKIILQIQDTSGFEDGFFFKVLNDGSSVIAVDAENGTSASHLIGPSSTSIFDPSTGFDLGDSTSAEFILNNSGASTTIFRL